MSHLWRSHSYQEGSRLGPQGPLPECPPSILPLGVPTSTTRSCHPILCWRDSPRSRLVIGTESPHHIRSCRLPPFPGSLNGLRVQGGKTIQAVMIAVKDRTTPNLDYLVPDSQARTAIRSTRQRGDG